MIFYENISKSNKEEIWNKSTITSNEAVSMFKENKAAFKEVYPNNFETSQNSSESTFKFVTLSSFLNCDHQKWMHCNLQTVGEIVFHKGFLKLYPLHNRSNYILLYIHSQDLKPLINSQMYAHVFGYPVFHESKEKIIPILPSELTKEPFLLFHIFNIINMESLANAKRLENTLCRINYVCDLIKR